MRPSMDARSIGIWLICCSLLVGGCFIRRDVTIVMPALASLLLAHLVADFPLQSEWVYRWRVCSVAGLALHAAIHVMVTALVLGDVGRHWPVLAWVGLLHFAIDWLKPYWKGPALARFLVDQVLHLLVLAGIVIIFPVRAALPVGLLYPILMYATLPAILMALWVFSSSQRSPDRAVRWMRYHLLGLSKIAGAPLLVTLSFWLITHD